MKKSQKERAAGYFKNNPHASLLYGTTDGSLFVSERHAQNHAKTLNKTAVEKITKEGVVATVKDLPKSPVKSIVDVSVSEIKKEISKIDDVGLIQALINKESIGKNRASALQVLNKRHDELTKGSLGEEE